MRKILIVKPGEFSNTRRSSSINSAAVKNVGRYILKSNSGKKSDVEVTDSTVKNTTKK